jgi:arabinofuranosyltransferase
MHEIRIPTYLYLIPIGIVSYFAWLTAEFQLDDALIYLRYIRNFHEGQGLSYNPGEAFNGLTSPLFSYIILTATYLLDYQVANIVVSAIFLSGAAIVAGAIFAQSRLEFALISSLLAGFSYFYTTFGMETSLYLFLIGMSLLLLKRNSDWFVVILALLGATRSEGIFLAAPGFVYFVACSRKLPRVTPMALSVVLFLVPLAINATMYGSPFPDTANAKIGQGQSGLWGEYLAFLHIRYMADWFFSGSWMSMIILAVFSAYGAYRARRSPIVRLAGVFLLLLSLFYLGFNIPSYHWYYAPFFYFGVIFCGMALGDSWVCFAREPWTLRRTICLITVCAIFIYSYAHAVDSRPKLPAEPYGSIGRWIENNTEREASLALVEVGAVGWNTKRYIIDILGLVTPHNAQHIARREWFGWLRHYQPDYILRHEPPQRTERSIPPLEAKGYYRPVEGFTFQGFVLLRRDPTFGREDAAQIASN